MTSRADQLAAGLGAVRARIEAACDRSGRSSDEITLVVVTKTFPASDVRLLASLGVHDVGENRDQEASAKVRECADLDVAWHFVGQLQSNKARSVARYADVVHSLDRVRLVDALARGARSAGRTLTALVQVALDDAPGRGGARPGEVAAVADRVASAPGLVLGGVMAVAPLGVDPRPAFARLARVSAALRDDHPGATWVSAGMSEDLEAALEHGATHVRVGSAILGARPPDG
ncbi:MAG TPA: YggS family pyridoxal phosphate-dependent enzyme [Jiangellales bacterium]|nr:YggS family pyridoxal phosphate-dependent enzyme [Jiangellales bacterium]